MKTVWYHEKLRSTPPPILTALSLRVKCGHKCCFQYCAEINGICYLIHWPEKDVAAHACYLCGVITADKLHSFQGIIGNSVS